MTSRLKEKSYQGAFWSAIDAVGTHLIQFIMGVILARLLVPEQFGLIGMLAIFMGIAQSFLTSGFGMALIQKDHVTKVDSSSVFYFNVFISIVPSLCVLGPGGSGAAWPFSCRHFSPLRGIR